MTKPSLTPGALPALTEDTRVKTNIKTIIGIGSTLIGAVIWCTNVHNNLSDLRDSKEKQAAKMEEMSARLANMEITINRIDVRTARENRSSFIEAYSMDVKK